MGRSELGQLPSELARGRSQFQAWRGQPPLISLHVHGDKILGANNR